MQDVPKPAPERRPTGAEEIRAAVVRAAGRRFAAEGLRASLRDIAADADVNVGLIHRHVGNKDDLVRAVLAGQSRAGARAVSRAKDLDEVFEWMFRHVDVGGDYVRIIAWLLLGGDAHGRYHRDYETIRALRDKMPEDGDDLSLMAAMTLVYGWTVFGDQLLDAFGKDPARREEIAGRLGALAARIAASSG
jgi:AcrR family transcriptional regulator